MVDRGTGHTHERMGVLLLGEKTDGKGQLVQSHLHLLSERTRFNLQKFLLSGVLKLML